MTWIIIGAAIGFFVGGAIGTIVAPQRAQKNLGCAAGAAERHTQRGSASGRRG